MVAFFSDGVQNFPQQVLVGNALGLTAEFILEALFGFVIRWG
jgi:hypothetical protein